LTACGCHTSTETRDVCGTVSLHHASIYSSVEVFIVRHWSIAGLPMPHQVMGRAIAVVVTRGLVFTLIPGASPVSLQASGCDGQTIASVRSPTMVRGDGGMMLRKSFHRKTETMLSGCTDESAPISTQVRLQISTRKPYFVLPGAGVRFVSSLLLRVGNAISTRSPALSAWTGEDCDLMYKSSIAKRTAQVLVEWSREKAWR